MAKCNYCGEKIKRRDVQACYVCYPFMEYGARGYELLTLLKVKRELKYEKIQN